MLLDSRDGLRKGGVSGPALEPGEPEKSLLIKAIRHTDPELKMPRKKKLPAAVIADFEAWVKMGAPDPRDKVQAVKSGQTWEEILRDTPHLVEPAAGPQSGAAAAEECRVVEPADRSLPAGQA